MSKRSRITGGKSRVTESIMVVEPDVLVRMTVAEYLRECGYRVVEAITGEEALKILGAGIKVDTVMSAVKLQGAMDAFALAQRIRNDFFDIEIILTTGVPMTAKKAGQLCDQGPQGRHHHPDLIVERLKLLFQKRQQRSGPA
jgi:CheY-like chemotaxis protein